MLRFTFLGLLLAAPLLAQPPADTCGPNDSLDGSSTMPLNLSAQVQTNDFTMTGAGCDERGLDHVTCFTPTDSCTINATCAAGGQGRGLQVAVNVFTEPDVRGGACSPSPSSCVASAAGTGVGSLNGLALTAGTEYCFVCETSINITVDLLLSETAGSCGALPVTLQSFSVDGS